MGSWEICSNELLKEIATVKDLSKTEFRELLSQTTKDSDVIFHGTLYYLIMN